jgi:hypothetical protein
MPGGLTIWRFYVGIYNHLEDFMKSEKETKLDNMTFAIQSLLNIYHNNDISSKRIKAEIKKTIHTLLSPDHWGEEHAVSKKAEEFIKDFPRNKYKKRLELSSWDDLKKEYLQVRDKEEQTGKKHDGFRGLILEHIILRSDIMYLLLKCNHDDPEEIKKIIRETKCAVIHWEEDVTLNLKYKYNRPDPIKAYDEYAKIKLINYKDMSAFIGKEGEEWIKKNIMSLPKYNK